MMRGPHGPWRPRARKLRLAGLGGLAGFGLLAGLGLLTGCGGGSSSGVASAPTLSLTSTVAGTTSAPVVISFSFSEDVGTSFTADDVMLSAGVKSTFTRVSAQAYALLVVPPANAAGSLTVSVAANAYAGPSGLPGVAAASLTQAFDTQAPTLTLSSSGAGTVARGEVTLGFSFSEDVGSSFTADDVQISFSSGTGTKGALTRQSATQASLVVTPPAGAAGRFDVFIAQGVFSDLAGNASPSAYFGAQQYDTR